MRVCPLVGGGGDCVNRTDRFDGCRPALRAEMVCFFALITLFSVSFAHFLSVLVTIVLGVLRSTTLATFGFVLLKLRPSSDDTDHGVVGGEIV